MIKSILLILLGLLGLQEAKAQQWVDKQYQYDSLLNVFYGTAVNFNGDLDTLHMDIYLPICEDINLSSPKPLLIWIHGGAFLAGDKNDASIQSFCKDFAKRGYVTASIDYRLGFVSDDFPWSCNYPNYSCVFATDSSEWARAYYRAIQDGKGALRFLINRHELFGIDTANVFVAGESAGAFVALGIGLLDTIVERPIQTFSISNAPNPHSNTLDCLYNQETEFTGTYVARPDLGGIDGDIEPTNVNYTIKGIGNMFGAMLSDMLKHTPANKPKPAIYSFHQPCDLVVSIDSNYVYWGLSWCFTNGYNCYGITNNQIMLYGSRTFSAWNTNNGYGYVIQNEYTSTGFPYSFIFGQGSCLDQVSNPCHGYDNRNLRETNLALFFANRITTNSICDTVSATNVVSSAQEDLIIFPNPTSGILNVAIKNLQAGLGSLEIFDLHGRKVVEVIQPDGIIPGTNIEVNVSHLATGLYLLIARDGNGRNIDDLKFVKE
jgi:hypothetical protein